RRGPAVRPRPGAARAAHARDTGALRPAAVGGPPLDHHLHPGPGGPRGRRRPRPVGASPTGRRPEGRAPGRGYPLPRSADPAAGRRSTRPRRERVSRAGAFDRGALLRASLAVGNPAAAAALEILGGGLLLRARAATVLALSGARAPLTLHRADEEGTDLELDADEAHELPLALDPG